MTDNTTEGHKQSLKKSSSFENDQTLFSSIDLAIRGYQNSETQIQSRLNNYFFAASILLLAWVTIYASQANITRIIVLIILSVLGFLISVLWLLLSLRQNLFMEVSNDNIIYLESLTNKNEFKIFSRLINLQKGKEVKLFTERKIIKLGFWETKINSRSLVRYSLTIFGIAFFILIVISIVEFF